MGLGEDGLVQPGQFDQAVGPPAVAHVKEARAGGVGHVDAQCAGHAVADVVLGADEQLHPREVVRLLLPEPQDLAAGVAGQHLVVGVGQKALQPAGLLGNPVALGLGPLVAPQYGGADDLVVLIQRHQAVHLTGIADARDVLGLHAGLGQYDLQPAHAGVPPVLGVLLRPAGLGGIERVLLGGGCDDLPLVVHDDALRAGGADIQTDQVFLAHGDLFLSVIYSLYAFSA